MEDNDFIKTLDKVIGQLKEAKYKRKRGLPELALTDVYEARYTLGKVIKECNKE